MSYFCINHIEICHKRKIQWYCPSNSNVNREIAFSEEVVDMNIPIIVVPRIGEKIKLGDGRQREVLDVIYIMNGGQSTIKVIVSSDIVEVEYYKYMKTFTHCVDSLKYQGGGEIEKKYEVVFPETYDEWIKDIEDLNDISNKSTEWRDQAEMRRCRLKK